MKRLIIVCEGQTEQSFCLTVLSPYFLSKGVVVEAPTIKHSHVGVVSWATLKRQLVEHLHEGDAIVTMLIDFYRIKDSYQFPGWEEAKEISNSMDKMNVMFIDMLNDMPEILRGRFVPYIQLHEFEGLLFSDISVFQNNFLPNECDLVAIQSAIDEFESPEDINNKPETAPSSRLLNAISGYDKVVFGSLLAEEITLSTIRSKCPLFNSWIERIEETNQGFLPDGLTNGE